MDDWSAIRWRLSLGTPPTVVQAGVSIHGRAHGPSVERYRLPDLWCVHLYRYEGELELAGTRFPIRPGHAGVIPADTPMAYRYLGPSEHCYFHFRPGNGPNTELPAMQPLGARFSALDARLSEAALAPSYSAARRQAVLWEVLWALTESATAAGQTDVAPKHPAVEHALRTIERHLAEPLSVADLAAQAGVSYSYLSRLFQDAVEDTVVGYIRRRRAERAEHLLRFSTLPIKAVAIAVGIPNLQNFNRMIHEAYGASPREVRQNTNQPAAD